MIILDSGVRIPIVETTPFEQIPFPPFLGLAAFVAVDKTKTALGKSAGSLFFLRSMNVSLHYGKSRQESGGHNNHKGKRKPFPRIRRSFDFHFKLVQLFFPIVETKILNEIDHAIPSPEKKST